MAIKKDITSRSGITLSYWKISDWRVILSQNSLQITLVPYVSSETRTDGLEPINEEIRKIRVIGEDYNNIFSPEALDKTDISIYKLMYNYIKENIDEFKDSEDI